MPDWFDQKVGRTSLQYTTADDRSKPAQISQISGGDSGYVAMRCDAQTSQMSATASCSMPIYSSTDRWGRAKPPPIDANPRRRVSRTHLDHKNRQTKQTFDCRRDRQRRL